MSLHFQMDLAFDIKDDAPETIILGLENLSNGIPLTEQQQQQIPNILQDFEASVMDNAFCGRSIFYFNKHYRYSDKYRWTLHFRQIIIDDLFYEEGYYLLAWLSLYAVTNGFVGYIKEELSNTPELIFFEQNEVIIKNTENKELRFSLADFNTDKYI